jgi:hypothetical protein
MKYAAELRDRGYTDVEIKEFFVKDEEEVIEK